MKPVNLLVLLLFLAGVVWALTRNERAVREIQRSYYTAIGPFLRSGSALETKARRFLDEVRTSGELETEVAGLRQEVGRLRLLEDRLPTLEAENARLRDALGFQQQARFQVVAARVIRRQPSTWWQTVIIDRGEEAGIGVQMPVVSGRGLVGKVDQPLRGMATVILLTDEACQVSARVHGTGETGILNGQRGAPESDPLLRLRYLSKDAAVRPGMEVYSTGRGGIFPANLLLGTIVSLETGSYDAEALVRPSVDFANLDTVFVVLGTEAS
jgi:rod shape-determining protein MreC